MKKSFLNRKAAYAAALAVLIGGLAWLPETTLTVSADGEEPDAAPTTTNADSPAPQDDDDPLASTTPSVIDPCAEGHNLKPVSEKPANCRENGYQAYYECNNCHKRFSDQYAQTEITDPVVIPANHASTTHYPDKAATCTEDGVNEYWECNICGEYLDGDGNKIQESATVIPKLRHDFSGTTYTGDETGHWIVCARTNCDEKQAVENHTWDYDNGSEKKTATCKEAGEVEYTCTATGCGQKKTVTTPKLTVHSYDRSDWEKDTKNHWHQCTVCGAKTDSALHTSDGGVITDPPTASAPGTKTYTCLICSGVIKTETVPQLDANHASKHLLEINSEFRYNESEHWKEYPCCGAIDVAKTNHSFVDDVKFNKDNKATCTKAGKTKEICTVCKYEKITIVPELNHKDADGNDATRTEAAVAATCDKTGKTASTVCTLCDEYTVPAMVIAKTPHTIPTGNGKADWTDTESGHYKTCSVCGHHIDSSNNDIGTGVEAHDMAGSVTVAPTADTTGVKTFTCRVCPYTYDKTLPKVSDDHQHSYRWVECSDGINHIKQCDCGKEMTSSKDAHTKDSGTVTKKPTTTETGTKTYKCSVCGKIMGTETIAALPPVIITPDDPKPDPKPDPIPDPTPDPAHKHSYSSVWSTNSSGHWYVCSCGNTSGYASHVSDGGWVTVSPTATTTGTKVYKCYVCGYVMKTETLAPTGINYYTGPVFSGYIPYYSTYAYYPYYYLNSAPKSSSSRVLTVNTGVTVNEKGITFSWDKVSGAKKYTIYRYSESTGKYTAVKETTGNTYTMSKPRNGMTYKFMVKYTASGKLSADALSGKITVTANFKPIVTAKAGKNSIKLSWQTVKGAEKYAVYRYINGKGAKVTETESTTYTVKGLESGKKYSYVVRAYVDGKWTTMTKSDIVNATTAK